MAWLLHFILIEWICFSPYLSPLSVWFLIHTIPISMISGIDSAQIVSAYIFTLSASSNILQLMPIAYSPSHIIEHKKATRWCVIIPKWYIVKDIVV